LLFDAIQKASTECCARADRLRNYVNHLWWSISPNKKQASTHREPE